MAGIQKEFEALQLRVNTHLIVIDVHQRAIREDFANFGKKIAGSPERSGVSDLTYEPFRAELDFCKEKVVETGCDCSEIKLIVDTANKNIIAETNNAVKRELQQFDISGIKRDHQIQVTKLEAHIQELYARMDDLLNHQANDTTSIIAKILDNQQSEEKLAEIKRLAEKQSQKVEGLKEDLSKSSEILEEIKGIQFPQNIATRDDVAKVTQLIPSNIAEKSDVQRCEEQMRELLQIVREQDSKLASLHVRPSSDKLNKALDDMERDLTRLRESGLM